MNQSRFATLVEAASGVAFGYVISVGAGHFIYPLFNPDITLADNMGLTLIFTVLSFVRSYITRRFFNWLSIRREVEARLRQQ